MTFRRSLSRTALAVCVGLAAAVPLQAQDAPKPSGGQITPIRPPAVPLIVRSPYVSTWQPADALPGTWSAFWNGSIKAMTGVARIDGKAYTFMGAPRNADGQPLAPFMTQTALNVTPTQSRYTFETGGVTLTLDFLSPVEADDIRRLSMPFGYIFAQASSMDGKPHTVSLYFDITGEWAHGDNKAPVTWDRQQLAGKNPLTVWTVAPSEPKVLGETNEYPMWGQAIWATATAPNLTTQSGADTDVRAAAVAQDRLNDTVDANKPRAISDQWPVFAYDVDLGQVGRKAAKPIVLVLGDVRDPAVSYLGKPVPPLWKSYWPDWQSMLSFAYADAGDAQKRADKLDKKITADATRAGGPKYAALCALALRQAFGATEMVGTADKPWMFMKEISSDGNISTVDVLYPAFPVFMYTNPHLLRLQLDPLFDYAETGGWPKPFAPHDIGSSYPNAAGHNNGKEEDMPVEESANMLIMTAAYLRDAPRPEAQAYAKAHYKILKQWTDYLLTVPDGATKPNALDPQLQNQTDDFTGFIAHSANLALKGILGVGAMGQISAFAGQSADAAHYGSEAKSMIGQWAQLAQSKTGDHLSLAYGMDDTWSLKYNAFPDKVLGLNIIPQSVLQEEARYYTTKENAFGIPLDGRHTYTKGDWELWTAASTDDPALRQFFIGSVYKFADTSDFRGAFSDWYDTVSGQRKGFVARPVIGGIYALLARQRTPTDAK